jgi:hypothetical protein
MRARSVDIQSGAPMLQDALRELREAGSVNTDWKTLKVSNIYA